MWEGEAGSTERPWMQFIGLLPIPIEIGEPGREIFEGYGSAASMQRQDFMASPTAV